MTDANETYVKDVTEIKRLAGRVKKLIDVGETSKSKYASQAVYNAKGRVARMRNELAHLVKTLEQFIPQTKPERAPPVPSEVKDGS